MWTALVVGSYLLGAVSFSYLIVRSLHGFDVRNLGSGNAGATNVLRITGPGPALGVLLLDFGKGLVAVGVARRLDAPGAVIGAVAVACVVGHVFPVYYDFRGGKGVATMAGTLISLSPLPAAMAAGTFLLVVAASRYVALGSITGSSLFPFLAWLAARQGWIPEAPAWLIMSSAVVAVLIIFKHSENIRRIRHGSEWKLGDPRSELPGGVPHERKEEAV